MAEFGSIHMMLACSHVEYESCGAVEASTELLKRQVWEVRKHIVGTPDRVKGKVHAAVETPARCQYHRRAAKEAMCSEQSLREIRMLYSQHKVETSQLFRANLMPPCALVAGCGAAGFNIPPSTCSFLSPSSSFLE